LREIPLFRFVSVDELFRIAAISQQVRYEPGATVQSKGAPAEYIQVLLEGSFEIQIGPDATERLNPPTMLGFQEVLEGATLQNAAHASTESVALVMPAEEFRTLLSANIELAQGLFRMLLEKNGDDASPSRTRVPISPLPSEDLKTVDKALYLQTLPIFARATADELYVLAAITREVVFPSDEILFSEGHPSSILLVLAGGVALESPSGGKATNASAGDCLGYEETLAGSDWSWRGRATSAGRALRIDREALFELLADHTDLLQEIFGAIFGVHRTDSSRS
jgi:CRP-like cAMP-binding protein